jgi:hypothetical protein
MQRRRAKLPIKQSTGSWTAANTYINAAEDIANWAQLILGGK